MPKMVRFHEVGGPEVLRIEEELGSKARFAGISAMPFMRARETRRDPTVIEPL